MIGHELDSVDIVPRSCLPLDLKTKLGEVVAWLGRETKVLFVDAPLRLQADPAYMLERQSKDPQDALRCYPRRPEDSRIDWSVAAIDVLLLFNVSNKHYAGAFCGYEGRPLIIWEAETIDDGERFCARPGQITAIAEQTVDLACGLGKLRIRQVKLDAEPMSAARCITSIRKRLM
jgi:methionyl-tRNA formyltransferase